MSSFPFVTVMIPMRNEAATISACVDSVLAQDYPADRFEVLVVDGDSADDSVRVVEGYAQRTTCARVLRNPQRIVPTALNIAIRAARGDVIMRVDGHTHIAPDYMRIGVETLQRTNADNVGGPMISAGGGVIGEAIALATASRFGIGAYFHFGTEEAEVDTVYLGMYPRSVFERVGLFDEEMVRNQDDEFNYRLRKAGGRIVLSPRMRSTYQNRQSLKALAKQYVQYGVWKVRVLQKHPRQMSWRHFVPPTFVLALALAAVFAPWVRGAALLALLTAGLYGAAVSVVAARLARAAGGWLWLPLVAAFATLHVSWGGGFVAGLLWFAPRWFAADAPPPQLAPPTGDVRNLGWSQPAAET
ncbi:MAG: glycosyltransferase family 2 protein [Deltaproteobacteria bacterium]|nr:glycosyltransferase family 2 protein [Deltaproteobacteria bacterium]MBI3389769.1 glycosyltransferase family 2 protein [Deltaproteobacteria bacterium]